MLPDRKVHEVGALRLVIYDFPDVGCELPLHSHAPGDAHVTFVNKGRIRAWGPGWEEDIGPGETLVFEPGDEHAFTALEPGSRVTNIVY